MDDYSSWHSGEAESFVIRWFLGHLFHSRNRWDSPHFIWYFQFSDIHGQRRHWKKYSQMYSWVQKVHAVPDPALGTSAVAVTTNFVLASQQFTRTRQARGSANAKCKLTDGPEAPSAHWLSRLSFTSCHDTFPCVTVLRTPAGHCPRMPYILPVWHSLGKH